MADKVDLFKSSRLKQQSAFVLQHRAGAAVFVLFIRDAMLKDEFAQPSKTPELFILPRICMSVVSLECIRVSKTGSRPGDPEAGP